MNRALFKVNANSKQGEASVPNETKIKPFEVRLKNQKKSNKVHPVCPSTP